MTNSWPEHTLDESKFNDVFQLVQTFELHCAKVYDHATTHPDGTASADYVMQLASQAYRAVHSLHMQTMASKYLDMGTAKAELESKALEYREGRELSSTNEDTTADARTRNASSAGLEDLLNGDFEDDDEEEDSDWEESEEGTDDEYYEYCEGSDSDSELDDLREAPIIQENPPVEQKKPVDDEPPLEVENATKHQEPITKETPPPISIIKDQASHDRITAALQGLYLPSDEPEPSALTKMETHIDRPMTNRSAPPIDDTRSEATAMQIESGQEVPLETSATAPVGNAVQDTSLDTARLRRRLSMRSLPHALPRRLKTVCHKYVKRHLS